jgi:hypothetical protein
MLKNSLSISLWLALVTIPTALAQNNPVSILLLRPNLQGLTAPTTTNPSPGRGPRNNPFADQGSFGDQMGDDGGKLLDQLNEPDPKPSPSPSRANSPVAADQPASLPATQQTPVSVIGNMQVSSYAHVDSSGRIILVDHPTSAVPQNALQTGTYVSSIGASARAFLANLPPGADGALIGFSPNGKVTSQSYFSKTTGILATPTSGPGINAAKALGNMWNSSLKSRDTGSESNTSLPYALLVVKHSDGPDATNVLTTHVTDTAKTLIANWSAQHPKSAKQERQ